MKSLEFIISSNRLGLAKLDNSFVSPSYLTWLNDPEVQAFTRRRGRVVTGQELIDFVNADHGKDHHFAIVIKDGLKHIGNLSINNVDEQNQSAELSIMLGDRSVWGQGFGQEAIELAQAFAFGHLGLHRLWAESPNPAFNALMRKLNWTEEGIKHAAFKQNNTFLDLVCWSVVADHLPKENAGLTTALLMTVDSPMGLKYLQAMIENNLAPRIVIISATRKLSDLAIKTVGERTNGALTWQSLEENLKDQNIPVFYTSSHNSDFCISLIKKYLVDLAILGGTGIIKEHLLSVPKLGIINVHPGILPKYRGCSSVEWSILNNDQVGATCHFVTPEIDAGPIVCIEPAKIKRGDLYADVRLKAYNLQPLTLIKGLKLLSQPGWKNNLLPNTGNNYFDNMSAADLDQVKQKLIDQKYSAYSE